MTQYLNFNHIHYAIANLPQLVFEVTDACNLKCTYCAYGELYEDYDRRENKMLAIDKALRLIDYLTPFWSSNKNASTKRRIAISFYGGEPLLNMPFIKAVVDYMEHKLNVPHLVPVFSMTTNALLLHQNMDYLQKHKFTLLISLDGNSKNTAYRIDKVGVSAFDRVVKNIDLLKKKYPDYFNKQVGFNAVLHNKNSVEEIYHFFKDKYNKIPRIGELNTMGIRKDMQETFRSTYKNTEESLQQAEHYEEIEQELYVQAGTIQTLTHFLHQHSGFVYKDYTDLLFDRSEQQVCPTGTCMPFTRKMYITVNGKILPCERIGHQFALGEITDTEVVLNAEAIADKYNAYYAKMEKQCSMCKNAKACIQCIYNLTNLEKNPVCYGYMNEKAFERYADIQKHFLERHPELYKKIMEEVQVT
jgi:uncharacterized protein